MKLFKLRLAFLVVGALASSFLDASNKFASFLYYRQNQYLV
jgi:hypothetical protein